MYFPNRAGWYYIVCDKTCVIFGYQCTFLNHYRRNIICMHTPADFNWSQGQEGQMRSQPMLHLTTLSSINTHGGGPADA